MVAHLKEVFLRSARIRSGQIIAVGSSVVFTQNPPIDDAARKPAQPFVLASCH